MALSLSRDDDNEEGCCLLELESEAEEDHVLPFAIHEHDNTSVIKPWPSGTRSTCIETYGPSMLSSVSLSSCNNNNNNNSHQPPGLASSILSCQTEETSSCCTTSDGRPTTTTTTTSQLPAASWATTSMLRDNTHMLSSEQLDVAASLLAGGSLALSRAYLGNQAMGHSGRVLATPPPASFSSLEYSRLMNHAGGTSSMFQEAAAAAAALPSLPEEGDDESTIVPGADPDSFHSAGAFDHSSSAFPCNIATTTSQTMYPSSSSDWIPIQQQHHHQYHGSYQPPTLNSSSLEPARVSTRRRLQLSRLDRARAVEARKLDATSFEVSIVLDQPGLQVDDVMEVLGNPSYLVLWCDSIRSLVITKSSEGARNATHRTTAMVNWSSNSTNQQAQAQEQRARADYEGEWIEATCTDLISPPSPSSCWYSTSKAVWNYVGFPTNYGTVSMFVERRQGRVGITMGPFAGHVMVSHTLLVVQDAQGTTRIVDRVRLHREGSNELMCGMLDCLEGCLLPTLNAYMEQVVSSLIRLRSLVETAEVYHCPNNNSNSSSSNNPMEEDFELLM